MESESQVLFEQYVPTILETGNSMISTNPDDGLIEKKCNAIGCEKTFPKQWKAIGNYNG